MISNAVVAVLTGQPLRVQYFDTDATLFLISRQ